MDSTHGASGSGNEQSSNSRNGKLYHRHSKHQTQQLEAFFKEFPHPDEKQRHQLSRELGLSPQQIKFWFQNKRTQKKTMNERSDNNALKTENERIWHENMAMREALKNITCLVCRQAGSSHQVQDQSQSLVTLRTENLRLRKEANFLLQEEMSNLFTGKSASAPPDFDNTPDAPEMPRSPPYQYPSMGFRETDITAIIETAVSAMNELIELLHVKDPLWNTSPSDGRSTLHRDTYDKLYPKPNHFKSPNARMESSKDSAEVAMAAGQLVEVFLNPNKWKDMFPTIITKVKTFEIIDTSATICNGSIHLMYEKMHVLSPLVAPREFFFIRFIQHTAPATWVMVDVSYDFIKHLQDNPSRSWKLPSGCMIQDKSHGKSFVTWIEHVEVDDKSLTHRLYRDVVSYAYGAKRWITTLQRMCDRLTCSMGIATSPRHELEGVINSVEGRRNLMRLSHRMVRSLSEILSMSDRLDFSHLSELNNTGVRISVRISRGTGLPNGLIVSAATSISLPFSNKELFDFLNDETRRPQWDVLSAGNPVNAIARISTGSDPGNCIAIMQIAINH
ncbi:hypothetical protein ACS0TY_028926 [Phlomoides rotata]